MNTISINSSITVDSYQTVDDLNIIDETVQVDIVDALFTSTKPNWDINDPDSPYYIQNKPTNTSAFVNDGSDGTSRYVELDELTDQNLVNDVQVKTNNGFVSVVEQKIAKIDLSNYVTKEFKTGSNTLYKVLSDNNLTDENLAKISYLRTNGDGSQALTNDGSYKNLYNILSVNNQTPDVNKNITITPSNINYGEGTLSNFLATLVPFNSAADRSITLDNNKFLFGKNTSGNALNLIGVNNSNNLLIGNVNTSLTINSMARPLINSESMAYLSDISSSITAHNTSESAHADIRTELNTVESYAVMQMSNLEMTAIIASGQLDDGKLVIPTDTDTYIAGKIYKFITGTPNRFELKSNWQVANIYRSTAPTTSTVGVMNQVCYDVVAKKIYLCVGVSNNSYIWNDITPASSTDTDLIQNIINNTQLIADTDGGFTAGNNYLLLDSEGIIPIERIPQSVLTGMTYGGEFGSDGIIDASSSAQALDGQLIDNVNKLFYKNYYFMATAQYTLEGDVYYAGNFALSSGIEWVKISNSGQVLSVNGYTGIVTLTYTDVNAIGLDKLKSAWSATTSDDNVPSEKLVKDSLNTIQADVNTRALKTITINSYPLSSNILLTKSDIGLANVDNTSDIDKPISTATQSALTNITVKIPTAASSSNQLADKAFVNSSINALAAFYITSNASGDAFATKAALTSGPWYYAGATRTPTNNDYAIVLADETQNNATTRYSYQGNQWAFQYIVNNTPFTQAQLDALNSGITNTLVSQITTNVSDISNLDLTKADKSTIADYTLSVAGWSNNSQTISISGKTSSNNARVSNSNTGTNEVVLANSTAISEANIYKIIDNGTTLTFTCENVPSVALTIQVEVYE
ncbi:MAG: hypothetical protein RR342_01030 [Bacilli bacterium]